MTTATTGQSNGTKPRFLLKACPRCGGDLAFRSDFFGDYYDCLQCSAEIEPRIAGISELKETRKAA